MDIRQELIELCVDMVGFWEQLKNEVELIPETKLDEVVHKWNTYFKDHVESVYKLTSAKEHIEEYEAEQYED